MCSRVAIATLESWIECARVPSSRVCNIVTAYFTISVSIVTIVSLEKQESNNEINEHSIFYNTNDGNCCCTLHYLMWLHKPDLPACSGTRDLVACNKHVVEPRKPRKPMIRRRIKRHSRTCMGACPSTETRSYSFTGETKQTSFCANSPEVKDLRRPGSLNYHWLAFRFGWETCIHSIPCLNTILCSNTFTLAWRTLMLTGN